MKRVIPAQAGIYLWNLKKPFYPISFFADRSGFPPARE
ncbi:fimbrial protein P9-2 precursor [Neisseria meningitidis]|nr:fimbrial protein P9-2 precursor [Neisseria meningitidis]